MTTQRVGLLGGSFNPPHICHLLSSIYLLETGVFDEVWWIPAVRHPLPGAKAALQPWALRYAWCTAATYQHTHIKVSHVEQQLARTPGRSYAIDTVLELRRLHAKVTFGWIIGSDLLDQLPRWHRWHELARLIDFHVVGRAEDVGPGSRDCEGRPRMPQQGWFRFHDFQLPDVSSSAIRALLAQGDHAAARRRLPAGVAQCFQHGNPYRECAAACAPPTTEGAAAR